MRYLIGLLFWVSIYAQGAVIITTGVRLNNNAPTISYTTVPGTPINTGSLVAQGWTNIGLGTIIKELGPGSPNPGGPSPHIRPYGSMLGLPGTSLGLSYNDTWETAMEKLLAALPASSGSVTGRTGLSNYYTYEACVVLANCYNCGGYVEPYPGSCSTIPWSGVSCDIASPSIILNHNTLQVSEVNGHRATENLRVTCSGNTLVRFRVLNPSIDVGNGITSEIWIYDLFMGGANANATFPVNASGLTVPIESRLKATNPQGGTFSGSTVVLVDVI